MKQEKKEIRSRFIRQYKNYFWLLIALGVAFALCVALAGVTTDYIELNGQTKCVL